MNKLDTNLAAVYAEELQRPSNDSMGIYNKARRLYLLGRSQDLLQLVADLESSSRCTSEVLSLIKLRTAIRLGDGIKKQIWVVEENKERFGDLLAEANLVLAMAYEDIANDLRAKELYSEAYQQFLKLGDDKKASAAYHNAIAAESRIDPDTPRFFEYGVAADMALQSKDFATYGAAINNMARDYQIAGALRVALKKVSEAVEVLRKHHNFTYQYYFTVANRCHILVNLGQLSCAKVDFEEFCCSPFREHESAKTTLAKMLDLSHQLEEGKLPEAAKTWQRRGQAIEKELARVDQLTTKESDLLSILSTGPKSKIELIVELYRIDSNILGYENRLKQLIHRLRKKVPHLLTYKDGKYSLS